MDILHRSRKKPKIRINTHDPFRRVVVRSLNRRARTLYIRCLTSVLQVKSFGGFVIISRIVVYIYIIIKKIKK